MPTTNNQNLEFDGDKLDDVLRQQGLNWTFDRPYHNKYTTIYIIEDTDDSADDSADDDDEDKCCGKGRTDDNIYLKIAVSNGEQTETFYRHINKYRDEQEWIDYTDDEYDYELWCDLQLDYDGKDMDGDIEEINQWHYGNGVYKVTDVEYPGIKVEIIGIC